MKIWYIYTIAIQTYTYVRIHIHVAHAPKTFQKSQMEIIIFSSQPKTKWATQKPPHQKNLSQPPPIGRCLPRPVVALRDRACKTGHVVRCSAFWVQNSGQIGDGHHTFNRYLRPYYQVDDHPYQEFWNPWTHGRASAQLPKNWNHLRGYNGSVSGAIWRQNQGDMLLDSQTSSLPGPCSICEHVCVT